MNKRFIIFGALMPDKLRFLRLRSDYVIACDKGYEVCKLLDIKPDMIIGDFDSLGFIPEASNITVLPVRKDDTDLGFAINKAISLNAEEIYVYGAVGGRLDLTVANISLCAAACKKGIKTVFYGNDFDFTVLRSGQSLYFKKPEPKKTVSVFALEKCSGVNLCGFEYNLQSACLDPLFPLGVSNAFKDETAEISLETGLLLILRQC